MLQAPIKWAQRCTSLFITVDLQDVTDEEIEITDTQLDFRGKSNGQEFEAHLEFYKPIDASKSKYKISGRSVKFHLIKPPLPNDEKERKVAMEHWPHLLKDKTLENNERYLVTVDWDRWIEPEDEDEEDEDFDSSAFSGLV